VRAVYGIASRFVARARRGEGPGFLQCNTYRYTGHHVGDINREYYRSKTEEQLWKAERDPIKIFSDWLLAQGQAEASLLKKIQDEIRAQMEAAVKLAIESPYPSLDEVEKHVYA
jgi:pyruvate dehydrogenase E1 component alpha subunit